jgi:hypothetical protein
MGHASIQQTFDAYGYPFEVHDDDKAAMAAVEIRSALRRSGSAVRGQDSVGFD